MVQLGIIRRSAWVHHRSSEVTQDWGVSRAAEKYLNLGQTIINMETIRQPLSQVQLELLRLFNRDVDDADWLEIRRMITRYFTNKATNAADKLWEEQGWSDNTMTEWLNTHQRTPYKQP